MGSIRRITRECMGTDKPLISILMAVYEPRMDWLREQLDSLEAQTYPNLRLYIRDDCSPTVPYEDIKRCIAGSIKSIPYEIHRNGKNIGSNLTFQMLTEEAEGECFAYCDQDDVWLPEKLTVLWAEMERTGSQLVCSDMYIIDGYGRQIADSITKIRRRHRFHSGEGLAVNLLVSNFVTGCTMLVRSKTAKAAVPFCPYMVHDHYLALWAAEYGIISSLPGAFIYYRIHGNNQTGVFAGVTDKKSYGTQRIDMMSARFDWLRLHFPCGRETEKAINEGTLWMEARKRNWAHLGGKATIWKYRYFSKSYSIFEIIGSEFPEPLFKLAIQAGKKNIV